MGIRTFMLKSRETPGVSATFRNSPLKNAFGLSPHSFVKENAVV